MNQSLARTAVVASTVRLLLALLAMPGCTPSPMRAFAIVVDRSESIEDGTGSSCRVLAGVASHLMMETGVDARSTLQVWLTGDANGAPQQIFAPTAMPTASGNMLDADTHVKGKRDAFLATVVGACTAAVSQAGRSPIRIAVEAAAQALAGVGCGPNSNCGLVVVTDGQENEDPALRDLITPPKRASTLVPSPILAEGLSVRLCGWQAVRTKIDSPLLARTADAWRSTIEGESRFSFDAACPVGPG